MNDALSENYCHLSNDILCRNNTEVQYKSQLLSSHLDIQNGIRVV